MSNSDALPVTPTYVIKSRDTSLGRPGLAIMKNQRADMGSLHTRQQQNPGTNANDLISSVKTKPSFSNVLNIHQQNSSNRIYLPSDRESNKPNADCGTDSDAGVHPFGDKKKVSPAPISRFAPRMSGLALNRGLSLHCNRVTLPFNKQNSFTGGLYSPFEGDSKKLNAARFDFSGGLFKGL